MREVLLVIAFMLQVPSMLYAQSMKLKKNDLKKLQQIMAGNFDSELQAKTDSSYFHIKLHMTPIWIDEINGYWLYVEQSMANVEDKPYRQRVYHLYKQDDTALVSKVYEIKNASQYIGAWKELPKISVLSIDSLIERPGCAIFLHKRRKNVYSGSTPWRDCLSTFKGAAYATSEVVIYKRKLISWDRGWDEKDKQVWGAVKGGYSFVKKKK
jgi:CpeT protein